MSRKRWFALHQQLFPRASELWGFRSFRLRKQRVKKLREFLGSSFVFVQAAARAYRLAQRGDFLLGGKWKPVVDWADTDPEIPEEEMAKVGTCQKGRA